MTDSDHTLTARTGTAGRRGGTGERLDNEAVTRHLRRLAAAYPEFTFSHELVNPRNGKRWVARRRNGADPGVWIVITRDLMELHAALAAYKGDCLAR